MKTQVLKKIRLMTFTIALSFLTMNVFGSHTDEQKAGEGEDEKTQQMDNSEIKEKNEIEPWMVDNNFWKIQNNTKQDKNNIFQSEKEQLEKWMLSSDSFRIIDPYTKEKSLLEAWMFNKNNFKTKEQTEADEIEDWMINADYWNV